MNKDDKMFLEFMDYLAFEEYEREQNEKELEEQALFDNDDDSYDYINYSPSKNLSDYESPLKKKSMTVLRQIKI